MHLRYHTKSASNKHKEINDLDSNKIKSYYVSKYIVEKEKKQLMGWKKIFKNNISAKGLVSKICQQLL